MSRKTAFRAEIDEFETVPSLEQITGQLPLYNKEEYPDIVKIGHLNYSKEFIPVNGCFPGARFYGSVLLSSEPPNLDTAITSNATTAEFDVELNDVLSKEVYLYLEDRNSGENMGIMIMNKQILPDWLEKEGDAGYVVVELEYDHELTKDRTGQTDEEIDKRRHHCQEKFEEWKTEYL